MSILYFKLFLLFFRLLAAVVIRSKDLMENATAIDWPGIRAAAVAVGVREAARRAGANLPADELKRFVDRVMQRSAREGWIKEKNATIAEARTEQQEKPMSAIVSNGADALANTLAERKEKTKLHLSRYVVDASENAADSGGDLELAPRVREVAQIAGHVWPETKANDDGNTLILSIGGNVSLGGQHVHTAGKDE